MKKIAIVHDNLIEYGGSERVLEHILSLYPQADLYTFFFNKKNPQIREKFGHLHWITSPAQHFPQLSSLRQYFSLLKPVAWWYFSRLDLSDYDLVISSSHSYNSKSVRVGKKTLHLSYIYTPPRFLYGYSHELPHLTGLFFTQWLSSWMRKKDYQDAQKPTHVLVSSQEIQRRVRTYYGRKSSVIHPPVPPLKLTGSSQKNTKKEYYVAHSRLVRQKGIEFLIKACAEYKLPLKVIGDGYLKKKLESVAGPQTEFVGFVPEKKLSKIYAKAKALLYASQDEDFGIVPVEAQSCGVPVIAYKSKALRETIVEGQTGYFFDTLTTQAVYAAIQKLEKHPLRPADCVRQAARFQPKFFKMRLKSLVEKYST